MTAANRPIVANDERVRLESFIHRLAPTHTKNRGIKKPYPIVCTSSIIFLYFNVCPMISPATNAPIIPATPNESAKKV
jgi:hypothetical protein